MPKTYTVGQDQKDVYIDIATLATKHQADFMNNINDVVNPSTFNYKYTQGKDFDEDIIKNSKEYKKADKDGHTENYNVIEIVDNNADVQTFLVKKL
jgi:hypothetical protein